jgi:molybdate transport system substrate-binding protein
VANAPDEINAKIVYPVAAVKASKNIEEAKSYIDYLFGTSAKTVFGKFGFTVITK